MLCILIYGILIYGMLIYVILTIEISLTHNICEIIFCYACNLPPAYRPLI